MHKRAVSAHLTVSWQLTVCCMRGSVLCTRETPLNKTSQIPVSRALKGAGEEGAGSRETRSQSTKRPRLLQRDKWQWRRKRDWMVATGTAGDIFAWAVQEGFCEEVTLKVNLNSKKEPVTWLPGGQGARPPHQAGGRSWGSGWPAAQGVPANRVRTISFPAALFSPDHLSRDCSWFPVSGNTRQAKFPNASCQTHEPNNLHLKTWTSWLFKTL